MGFVNIHGQPIDVGSAPTKKKVATKAAGGNGLEHKGWYAVGYPPEQIEEGRRDYEAGAELRRREGKEVAPFNVETFVRTTKPRKIRSKAYATQSAAIDAGKLAEKTAGWIYTSFQDATSKKK